VHYSFHADSIEARNFPYYFRGLCFPCFEFQGTTLTSDDDGGDELILNSSNLLEPYQSSYYSKF
jgi:hypothetical protein